MRQDLCIQSFNLKERSDSEFSVVGLEVEFVARRSKSSRHLLVQVSHVSLELALAVGCCQVEGELFGVLHFLTLLGVEPNVITLVHEVLVPCLVPQNTEVLQQLQRVHFGYN